MPKRMRVSLVLALSLSAFIFGQSKNDSSLAMMEAAKEGNSKKILELLMGGADVNCRGNFGYTPLITAAKHSQLEIARLLCDRGADPNAAAAISELDGEWGSTPLLWAAKNCNMEMAGLLIEKGADVGRAGGEGDTPLILSAGNNCRPLVELLISAGAPIEAIRGFDGANALIEAVSNGHLDIAAYLIGMGADLKIRDRFGRSLLSLSSARKHFVEVRYFFEKGIPINDLDSDNCSAAFYSIGNSLESFYILEYLIKKGADPRIKSKNGVSPLMKASYEGLFDEVKLLIDSGATVEETDFRGETPLHYACRRIPHIREPGSKDIEAAEETVRLLLDKGAKPNSLDYEGQTPLMKAACGASSPAVTSILGKGVSLNFQDRNGWTALMYAAAWNQTEIIRVLIQHGAELNLKNSKGRTALGVAKEKEGTIQAYELLKSLGARGE